MTTPKIKNNKAGIAPKALLDAVWANMPKGKVKLTGHAKRLANTPVTDWTQTGNLALVNANGSLDFNPKSFINSDFTLND